MSVTIQPPAAEQPARRAGPPPRAPEPAVERRFTPRRILGGVLLVWLLSGFYIVQADEEVVATRFGKIAAERVTPGIHYNAPWPVGENYRLKVLQTQRAVVGGELADVAIGRGSPLQAQFLTGDQNIINVRTIVQYSVASARDYLFRAAEPGPLVRNAVEAELGRQIASRMVDEILTTEKVAIQEAVRLRSQALIDQYGLGVVISTVNIESVSAPPEAADAFRDVASARADSSRIVNEAEGYANDILPRARGEGRRLIESAQGARERAINTAKGDAARFDALVREYERNPAVTSSRLFYETMEEVLPRLRKTIVDEGGNLDLTIIRRKRERQ